MQDITLRKAEQKDIAPIVKLWRSMWDMHSKLDPRFTTTAIANDVMAKWVEENIQAERSLVMVACENNEVAGYILAMILENPPIVEAQFYGYISELVVRDDFRRKGLGAEFIVYTHKWFKENHARYAEINVSVYNNIAKPFWRKLGYKDFLERLRLEL